jgi:hypothetical protein
VGLLSIQAVLPFPCLFVERDKLNVVSIFPGQSLIPSELGTHMCSFLLCLTCGPDLTSCAGPAQACVVSCCVDHTTLLAYHTVLDDISHVLQQQQGKSNILVSTDVAARGLHINRLQYVVNYDFPLNLEQYCHRVGRTGRQGKEGQAYSLLSRNMSMLAADLIKLLEVRASKLV